MIQTYYFSIRSSRLERVGRGLLLPLFTENPRKRILGNPHSISLIAPCPLDQPLLTLTFEIRSKIRVTGSAHA
jgi:hypothetical protein